ncbi:hypothetical protein JOL79_06940 [Microbispora sp. RL4-1S]|uniref:Uncharacterized protein n=1 Tax=Microbispora oryzae TaxID=2806554 RepID=A0A940WDG8_9ACTN|nr:hypothetical protein [Microbispora oryzae]MBP2703534.1 hypothetical protein [Microbispora oryzae]
MGTSAAPARRARAAAAATKLDETTAGEQTLEPSRVIPPELRFTTGGRDDDQAGEAPEPVEFEIDDVTYTAIIPRKVDEVLAGLIEANARRATTADALYAGMKFMHRVIAPESLARLQARLDDDADKFRIGDLYDILGKLVKVVEAKAEERQRGRRR